MDTPPKRRWDTLLIAAAPFVTLIGILAGVWQFNVGRDREIQAAYRKDDIEFRRRLWMEQLESCRKVAEIAGVIAAPASSDAERAVAVKQFQAAYWGAMNIYEDKPVETAMIELSAELRDLDSGISDLDRIKFRVKALGTACRKSLRDGTPKKLAGKSD